jgi:ribonuclease HI
LCIKRAIASKSQKLISPLEYLARSFSEYTSTAMETIYPFPRPPWWTPSMYINISNNKKEAKKRHDETPQDPNTICIYTDGSGIDGHIGAAAYSPTIAETRQQYLGTESTQNVYAAELYAVKLAIDIVQSSATKYTNCTIYADSQAAIAATAKPRRQSGQSIICALLDNIDSLKVQQPNINISLIWIPGHMDIPGNEKVDQAAKEAAQSRGSLGTEFQHHNLKSSRNDVIRQAAKKEWETEWQNTPGSKQLKKITMKAQAQNSLTVYNSIDNRSQAVQIARLRTGHCSLNQYLHRFNIENSPECSCGNGSEETVEHYLLHCPNYDKEREKLFERVGIDGMWIEKLLGHPKLIPKTLEYIKETKRFKF